MYSIHLKRSDFSEASAAARKKDIEKAFQIIKRMQTTVTEKLEVLLGRVPFKHQASAKKGRASGQTRTAADSSNRKWPSAHDSYAEKHGLMPSDRQIPPDFVSEVGHLVSPRSLEASWLKLVVACQKAQEVWKNVLVVFPLSHSISFASVRQDIFPCVTPSDKYIILQEGRARVANGLEILAVQGIQEAEVSSFNLADEDDTLLRDLGGNAFTANIIIAFVIAGAVVM